MTPKEKAKELLNKYSWIIYSMDKYHAKKCILIAVDEVLDDAKGGYDDVIKTEYWQEVKNEIEKL